LIHGEGVAGGNERQWGECADLRECDLVGDATQMRCDPIGDRRPNAIADLYAVTADRDPAIRRDFHGSQRTVPSGAIVLGGARHSFHQLCTLFPGQFDGIRALPRHSSVPPAEEQGVTIHADSHQEKYVIVFMKLSTKAQAIIAKIMAPNEKVEAYGMLPEAAVKALGLKAGDFTRA
jgi:hypothetical protein